MKHVVHLCVFTNVHAHEDLARDGIIHCHCTRISQQKHLKLYIQLVKNYHFVTMRTLAPIKTLGVNIRTFQCFSRALTNNDEDILCSKKLLIKVPMGL